ncbi:MAG: NAD-dependent epimerase/dehydratase family protein [Deltaproteobacteria bacterium]|jgi:nucleoside-diphosphate-sugar epimerase|nr:NAD-dependent epimerase/dehydratase family protein [Deltaproteobacteria bacterium]
MAGDKLNCWEYMKCGRGPKGAKAKKLGVCPAASENRLDKIHGGINSGRACWVVAGTFCGGTVQGSFAKKQLACKRCDFYLKVHSEEGRKIENTHSLLKRLKDTSSRLDITQKRLGVIIGSSGLIGGALMYYFKTKTSGDIEVLGPNSKRLSLRQPDDIKRYFDKYHPDFIINCAITSLDSDAQLTLETNYLGAIRLAKMARLQKIPYIHFSSAATLPMGENLTEEDLRPIGPKLSNYAKSKLLAEKTLQYMHETQGLDYTTVRLAVVYGKHDHKIQGFQRLLFSIADQSMPFMLSKPGVCHSYSNTKKIPPFINHILESRDEFSGQSYNFVDQEPVEMVALIKAIKTYLNLKTPRELYIPYPVANSGKAFIKWLIKRLGRLGVVVRLPAELQFMKSFYETQTLSVEKLAKSSYRDPAPDVTVFTELTSIIDYYLVRWKHLNLFTAFHEDIKETSHPAAEFMDTPENLLEKINKYSHEPLEDFEAHL